MKWTRFLLFFCSALFLWACKTTEVTPPGDYKVSLSFGPGEEDAIRTALITMEDSTAIFLKAGTYNFEKLSIQGQLNQILFQGEGPDKTIIDFSNQGSGGEGMRVDNVNNFIIRDLTLKESAGDLLKVKEGENVQFINIHTIWDGEPEITNGGYGIYPVLCKNVEIDSCFARGASDAGVYVGQTIGAIVKNCRVEYCVAGIEIENTQNA